MTYKFNSTLICPPPKKDRLIEDWGYKQMYLLLEAWTEILKTQEIQKSRWYTVRKTKHALNQQFQRIINVPDTLEQGKMLEFKYMLPIG